MFLYLPPAQGQIGPAAQAAGGGLTWPWRVGPWRGRRGGQGPGGGRAGPGGWTGPGGQGGVGRDLHVQKSESLKKSSIHPKEETGGKKIDK